MAITTYNTLQDAVGTKLDRSAYQSGGANAANTEEWVGLAEARMNRIIRERQMSTRTQASVSSEYSALPDNFGGIVSARYTDTTNQPLRFYPSTALEMRSLKGSRRPKYFTIEADQFRWVPVPDEAYTIELIYYLRIPALTDSATTNWMLTDHPDAYLYGTLFHGMIELEYPENKVAGIDALFTRVMDEINQIDQFNKYPPGLLRMNKEFAGP